METNGLMVGDWVQIVGTDRFAGAKCKINMVKRSIGSDYCRVYIDDARFGMFFYEVFSDDIQPILLTEEILKKNKFRKDDISDQWYFLSNVRLDLGLLAVGIDNGCGVGICVMPNGAITYYCKYVHELQLFLRVIGGAKEIEL